MMFSNRTLLTYIALDQDEPSTVLTWEKTVPNSDEGLERMKEKMRLRSYRGKCDSFKTDYEFVKAKHSLMLCKIILTNRSVQSHLNTLRTKLYSYLFFLSKYSMKSKQILKSIRFAHKSRSVISKSHWQKAFHLLSMFSMFSIECTYHCYC